MFKKRFFIFLLVIVIFSFGLFFGCGKNAENPQNPSQEENAENATYTITILEDPSKYTCSFTTIQVEYNSVPTMPDIHVVDSNSQFARWILSDKRTIFAPNKEYTYTTDISIVPVLLTQDGEWSPHF